MKKNKGVTLIELTIVIALLSIVSILVVSFTSLVQKYSLAITTDNAVMEDIDAIEDVFDKWLYYFDDTDYSIYCSEDSTYLVIVNKDNHDEKYDLKLYKDNSLLIGTYKDESSSIRKNTYYANLNQVDDITFEIKDNSLNNCLLVKCSISYTYYNKYGTATKQDKEILIHTTRVLTLYDGGNSL